MLYEKGIIGFVYSVVLNIVLTLDNIEFGDDDIVVAWNNDGALITQSGKILERY